MLTCKALCSLSIFLWHAAIIRLGAVGSIIGNVICLESHRKDKSFYELKPEIFISHGGALFSLLYTVLPKKGRPQIIFKEHKHVLLSSLWQIVCTFPTFFTPSRKLWKCNKESSQAVAFLLCASPCFFNCKSVASCVILGRILLHPVV